MNKKNTNGEKVSFEAKHPKLNTLIGFLFIFIIGYVAIYAIVKIVKIGIEVLQIISGFDAVIIVALITGIVSIFTVLITKVIEYKNNRQDYLSKKREEPYGEFVDMVYKIQQNSENNIEYTEEEMAKDLSKFSKQITLWGSPKVVKKWVKFRGNGAKPEAAMDNLFLLEEIMNDMRKDLGVHKVDKGNLLGFFINDIKQIMKTNK